MTLTAVYRQTQQVSSRFLPPNRTVWSAQLLSPLLAMSKTFRSLWVTRHGVSVTTTFPHTGRQFPPRTTTRSKESFGWRLSMKWCA
jgi:hypothetical protein